MTGKGGNGGWKILSQDVKKKSMRVAGKFVLSFSGLQKEDIYHIYTKEE